MVRKQFAKLSAVNSAYEFDPHTLLQKMCVSSYGLRIDCKSIGNWFDSNHALHIGANVPSQANESPKLVG